MRFNVSRCVDAVEELGVRTLLVEDQPLARQAIRDFLRSAEDVTWLGAAVDGDELFRLLPELVPEVVLMDISLPGSNGLQLTRKLRALRPETVVVILSDHDNEQYRSAAAACGAAGFVAKQNIGVELLPLLRSLRLSLN